MPELLSIKVAVAGRTYPLKVAFEEEEVIRKAAKYINERLKEFEENYAVRDKQDLLAMCALNFATEAVKREGIGKADADVTRKISQLDQLVSAYIDKQS